MEFGKGWRRLEERREPKQEGGNREDEEGGALGLTEANKRSRIAALAGKDVYLMVTSDIRLFLHLHSAYVILPHRCAAMTDRKQLEEAPRQD